MSRTIICRSSHLSSAGGGGGWGGGPVVVPRRLNLPDFRPIIGTRDEVANMESRRRAAGRSGGAWRDMAILALVAAIVLFLIFAVFPKVRVPT